MCRTCLKCSVNLRSDQTFAVIHHQRNDADRANGGGREVGYIPRYTSDPLLMHAGRTADCRPGKSRSDVQRTTDQQASRPPGRWAPTTAVGTYSRLDSPLFPSDAGMLRATLMVGDEQPPTASR